MIPVLCVILRKTSHSKAQILLLLQDGPQKGDVQQGKCSIQVQLIIHS